MNKKTSDNLTDIISLATKAEIDKIGFREKITEFQNNMRDFEGSVVRKSYKENDELDTFNGGKLEHEFGEGTYIRKITMPKGMIYLSAIHLVRHPYFVMSGECTVISDKGLTKIKAPHHGMTEPGTQRILYIDEECVWVTVHPTDKTNVEDVIKDVTSENYNHPKLEI